MGRIEEAPEGELDDFHFLDAPIHPDVKRLLAYWNEKRGDRSMPVRADIVPSEIVSILPNIVIYDVVDDGQDFRVRIFGTALVELIGEERTGKLVSEFGNNCNPPTNAPGVRRRWMDSLAASYKTGQPACVTGTMSNSRRPYIVWHGISCPLGEHTTTQMIGIMTFER
jgi:hypothetical protein